jgi:hypothetical protein
MTNDELKYLEFIQNIITRMNSNSFQIKSWAITIVSALIAVFSSTNNLKFIFIGFFPVNMFWLLDTYYLNTEKKYRYIYNIITGHSPKTENIRIFDLDVRKVKMSYFKSLISTTLLYYYLFINIMLFFIIIFYKHWN